MGASLGQLHSSQWAAGMAVVVFCLLDPTIRNSFPLVPRSRILCRIFLSRGIYTYIFLFFSVMWYTRAIPWFEMYSRKKFEVEFLSRGIPWQNRNFWNELRKVRINGMKYVRFLFTIWLAIFQEIVSKCDS